MEQSVSLILEKLDQLIVAVGGSVEAFYPYVVKQQIIWGVTTIILTIFSLFLAGVGFYCGHKANWEETPLGAFGFIATLVGGLLFVVGFGTLWAYGIGQLLNPNYYAVKNILEIGETLIK